MEILIFVYSDLSDLSPTTSLSGKGIWQSEITMQHWPWKTVTDKIGLVTMSYLTVSNSLILESGKVRSLKLEFEPLTNCGSFFSF